MHACRFFPSWICHLFACMGFGKLVMLFLGLSLRYRFIQGIDTMCGMKSFRSFLVVAGYCCCVQMLALIESLKEKCKSFCRSRGCFGCCAKPPLITAVDEPSKGLQIQGRKVKKSSISGDFWSTSGGDMDNSAIQSQRSISSISTSNQAHDAAGSSSNPSEFVNHGLLLWNQTRQQWLGNKKSKEKPQVREPTISWNASYESLLGSSKPFPRPVPLPEMVDFLIEVWEQEGLYD